MMLRSDIMNNKGTNLGARFKQLTDKEQQDSTSKLYIFHQVSTDTHHYHHKEVSNTMTYTTEDKLLPQKESIDVIMSALTAEEKEEFFHELLHASIKVVLSGKSEYIEALRQLIIAWEYTAEIATNSELARDIDETREEIESDQSPGVEWRELLRG